MKKRTIGLLLALVFIFLGVCRTYAQDTLDVTPGYETLNLAVEGDTTLAGEPINLNRVYRLERNGHYLLNGRVFSLGDNHLNIVAAEGEGQMPILIPMTDETGGGTNGCFEVYGDGTFKGLYVGGVNDLGTVMKNNWRLEKAGGHYIIDDCFIDYTDAGQIRLNAENQTVIVTNSIFANWERAMDVRNPADSIVFQNCTFYNSGGTIRGRDNLIKEVIIDHTTWYQASRSSFNHTFRIGRTINLTFTNNLIVDLGFRGEVRGAGIPDSEWNKVRLGMLSIEPLEIPEVVLDSARVWKITNNVYGWTPEVRAWIDGIDSVYSWVFLNDSAQAMIDTLPNMVLENNIEESPVFSDAPDPDSLVVFAQAHLEELDPVFPDADRNGRGTLTDDPESFGPADDPYDFDYNTDALAYTYAEDGFPAGDLNWYPAQKAAWEAGDPPVLVGIADQISAIPEEFSLAQNYPNPFNPTTTISYQLKTAARVDLAIFNLLGQRVRTLVNGEKQAPGVFSLYWNGLDEAGQEVSSSVYFYRLEADNQVQVRKMMLLR